MRQETSRLPRTVPPRRSLPPLNATRAFEAAARHGSFTRAAEELGVTHGAVSRQVHLLEAWLGGPALFRRGSRGVSLTPDGEVLLAECGTALDRIAAAARRHRAGDTGPRATVLRVNALSTFSLRWLLPHLARFGTDHPGIEVRLTTSNQPLDSLPDEHDVIIRGGPDSFHGFTAFPIVGERRLPFCSPALLRRCPAPTIGDLERHTLLHVATMPRLWRDWLAEAGHPELQPAASLMLDHFYLAIQAAIDGLGVVVGPATLVAGDVAAGRLVAPFPGIDLPARGYYAYLPRRDGADSAGTTFCRWLSEVPPGSPTC